MTWSEWNAASNRFANALLELGARHGDRVVLLLNNSIEFAVAYYGLAKIGCISAPVMPRSVAGEVGSIVRSLRARFIITEAGAVAVINEIRNDVPSVEVVIGVGKGHGRAIDFNDVLSSASADEPPVAVDPNDPLTIKFTSGTTGAPKGWFAATATLSPRQPATSIEIPIDPDDSAIVAAPLLAAGMAISQMTMLVMRGVRIAMLPPVLNLMPFSRFSNAERPTLVYLMDGMSRRLFAASGFRVGGFLQRPALSSGQRARCGRAAACPGHLSCRVFIRLCVFRRRRADIGQAARALCGGA